MKFIKYFFSKCTHARTCFNKRGQAAVLYALLTPILLLFIGVTFDLGWYYLNVSRLQNAADSAAVAGAQTILESNNKNFSSYKSVALVKNYPGDEEHVYNFSDVSIEEVIEDSNGTAADYASKNLSRDAGWMLKGDDYVMMDAWSQDAATEVTMNPSIYQKDDELYYVIKLEEQIRHFFLPGWFDAMHAPVTAVAMLTKNNGRVAGENEDGQESSDKPQPISTKPTPIESASSARVLAEYEEEVIDERSNEIPRDSGAGAEGGLPEGTNILAEMYKIEDHSAIRNWEWQNYYIKNKNAYHAAIGRDDIDIYSGKWNEYQAKDSAKKQDKIRYEKGKNYRTETADVFPKSGSEGSKTGQVTNNDWTIVDSLNLDFVSDIQFKKSWLEQHWKDFDIVPDSSDPFIYTSNVTNDAKVNLRIHSTFNFETPYPVRADDKYDTVTNPEDVLYVRIESEPIENLNFRSKDNQNKQYASVRPIEHEQKGH